MDKEEIYVVFLVLIIRVVGLERAIIFERAYGGKAHSKLHLNLWILAGIQHYKCHSPSTHPSLPPTPPSTLPHSYPNLSSPSTLVYLLGL